MKSSDMTGGFLREKHLSIHDKRLSSTDDAKSHFVVCRNRFHPEAIRRSRGSGNRQLGSEHVPHRDVAILLLLRRARELPRSHHPLGFPQCRSGSFGRKRRNKNAFLRKLQFDTIRCVLPITLDEMRRPSGKAKAALQENTQEPKMEARGNQGFGEKLARRHHQKTKRARYRHQTAIVAIERKVHAACGRSSRQSSLGIPGK